MKLLVHCAVLLAIATTAGAASAQVFRVEAGGSTLLNAEGGSIAFKAPNYDGSIGAGLFNGKFEFGAESRYQYRGYTLLSGDESVPFFLPTDLFDASHYFSARGLGVTRADERERFYAFAGATATPLGTGFFNAASSDRPAAIFFYERKLPRRIKLFSRQIVSDRQTSLQGVEWKATRWFTTSSTAGIGSNQAYLAGSADVETSKFALKASYAATGDRFRRITVLSPISPEANKGNILALFKPTGFVSITAGHQNILEPLIPGGAMQQASVDQLSADFHVAHFSFGSGLLVSHSAGRRTQGTNLYLRRNLGAGFEAAANWFQSSPQGSGKTTIFSGTVRKRFTDRFSLLGLVSRSGGQTTFAAGGDFISNRLVLHLDYENVYLPFRPDRPFEQALALNTSLRITGPLQVILSSSVAPDGHIRYSLGANTYFYRVRGLMMRQQSLTSFAMGKYVVEGVVRTADGAPIEGAALRIGRETVYTDSTGGFVLRCSRQGPFAVKVVAEEFLSSVAYEVISAPSEVRAERDDAAVEMRIVLRSRPHPESANPQ